MVLSKRCKLPTIPLYILTFTVPINTSDVMMVIHNFQKYLFIPHDSSHFNSVHLRWSGDRLFSCGLTLYPLEAYYEQPLVLFSELSGFSHISGLLIENNDWICTRGGWECSLPMQLPLDKTRNYCNDCEIPSLLIYAEVSNLSRHHISSQKEYMFFCVLFGLTWIC